MGELEEKLSELEFEERCEEFVKIDDELLLIVSDWYVEVPSLALSFRSGVACVFDEDTEMYMPDFDVTVLYEGEPKSDKYSKIEDSVIITSDESTQESFYTDVLYYEQDGFVITLANWLNSRLSVSDIENLECYLICPEKEEINN